MIVRAITIFALVAATLTAQQQTIYPGDLTECPHVAGISAAGQSAPRELHALRDDPTNPNAEPLQNLQAAVDDLAAICPRLTGEEQQRAEEAAAYLRRLIDLRRVAMGQLAEGRAATLPDWLVLDPVGRVLGLGYGNPPPPRLPAPNWLIIDTDTLTGRGPFANPVDCLERFYRYTILMQEAYRALAMEWYAETGGLLAPSPCDWLRADIEAKARQIERIDSAIARGGMPPSADGTPASQALPACNFTEDELAFMQVDRDRLCGEIRRHCQRLPPLCVARGCQLCP